ncbi:hypothetical protein D3C85_1185900 [compost metagenome]
MCSKPLSSHSTFNTFFPCIAAQVVLATIATPSRKVLKTPMRTLKTLVTPGTFSVALASKLFTTPRKRGLRSTTAYCIPGNFLSSPKMAVPFVFKGVSCLSSGLRISLYSDIFFRTTSLGASSFEASTTNSP